MVFVLDKQQVLVLLDGGHIFSSALGRCVVFDAAELDVRA